MVVCFKGIDVCTQDIGIEEILTTAMFGKWLAQSHNLRLIFGHGDLTLCQQND